MKRRHRPARRPSLATAEPEADHPAAGGRFAAVGARVESSSRDAALRAVNDLLLEGPWEKISMAEVAARAGLSRQTLYNSFGDRTGLAEAYVLTETEAFLDRVEAAIRARPDEPRQALLAALGEFLRSAGEHPALRAIATGDGSAAAMLGPLVTGPGSPVLSLAVERLRRLAAELWPGVPDDVVAALAEVVVRLGISTATQPLGEPGASERHVARVLGPFLDQVVD